MDVNQIQDAIIDGTPVLSMVEGSFRPFASRGNVTLAIDDELEITAQARSVFATWVNVRKDGGPVIRLDRDSIRPLDLATYRPIGTVPAGAISPDDPGLAWLWQDAARLADKLGHCSTYDTMCDQLGIPGREREFEVRVEDGDVVISAKVMATSRPLAEKKLQALLVLEVSSDG